MNQLGKPHGALGVSSNEGIISPAYFVAHIGATAEPRFLHHLLRTRTYISEYERRGKYMPPSQFDISWEQFRSIPIALPPLDVQKAIADYLDAETARIDALVEKKRKMVDLAADRARTFISLATEESPYIPVRHLTSLRTSGPRGWADRIAESGQPFIRSANLRRDSIEIRVDNLAFVGVSTTQEARRSAVCVGDVLVGITGANLGWVGCVGADLAGGFVSQHVAILRPSNIEPEWLAYSLYSFRAQDQLLGGQYGGTKQQLGLDDLAELRIGNPPRDEQLRRVDAIRRERMAVDQLTLSLEHQVRLLNERRQALISAAAMGHLEVPGVAA